MKIMRWTMALAAIAALAWPCAEAIAAAKDSVESVRGVKRVTITDRGVRVQKSGADADQGGKDVDIDLGAVKVRTSSDDWDGIVVDGQGDNIVRVFSDIEVPAGQRADDVVAVFGSVTVAGEVMGDVVAVMGSLHLEPGAVVHGDAVAVGGVLDQPQGATVQGETVSVAFVPRIFGAPTLSSLILVALVGWLVAILVGWLLILLFPARMMRVAATASARTGLSLLLGIVAGPLLIIAMGLLCVTLIGIPVAILLPLVFLVAVWAGQIASAYLIGCRLLRRRVGENGAMAPVIAGTLFAVVFFAVGAILAGPEGASRTVALFFTLLGSLLVTGMSVIGTGAVLLSGFGSRPRDLNYDPRATTATLSPGLGPGASTSAPTP